MAADDADFDETRAGVARRRELDVQAAEIDTAEIL
jgi:hypothetical protein